MHCSTVFKFGVGASIVESRGVGQVRRPALDKGRDMQVSEIVLHHCFVGDVSETVP